ncbi:MAG: efflux RND transporter periplasmic adaptor subunit [Deltaproteobacteria bacterium]|nr:efflux RND transporter periplasmic adaptor subunit [Deltaproteobacteria bacterium]
MQRRIIIASAALVAAALIAGGWWWFGSRDRASGFRTVPVKRGDLKAFISATGTIEPEELVDVGTQVGGMILSFGKDKNGKTIDYGSAVEAGMILAKIDEALSVAAVEHARAQLQQAEANKTSAEATVLPMKARLLQARQDWDRAQQLGPSEALAQSAYDQFKANFEVARANLAAAEAAVIQAQAALVQAQAGLSTALSNLGYCTIRSPVKGVIIDRRVNIGQTVVSSLSAPSLFLIAKDLRRVTVWVSVNEADIGKIYLGQPVTFFVDAYPDREFRGRVDKIRLNATMTQNVVTYIVEVDTDNEDGKLLPYLTANTRFEVGRRQNSLLVPNGALRWSPEPGQVASKARPPAPSSRRETGGPQGPGGLKARGTVWVPEGRGVRPVSVAILLTDGTLSAVEGPGLTEGLRVVLGEELEEDEADSDTGRSPLLPMKKSKGRAERKTREAPDGER